jgi:hypothetical protein
MAREIIGAHPIRLNELGKEYPDRDNLQQNLNSPMVSQYGLSSGKVKQHGNTMTSLSKGFNFTSATLSTAGAIPPDNMGSVGPTQYIVAVNSIIISYNKTTGVADGALNVGMDNFPLSITTLGGYTIDPHIRYYRLSEKWYFIIYRCTQ